MARKKTPSTTKAESIDTRQEFDLAINLIATMSVEINELLAQKEARLQKVAIEEDDIINPKQEKIDTLIKAVEAYAAPRRVEIFGKDKKSAQTSLARFGYRNGQPTLKPMKGWKMDAVINELKSKEKGFCINTKETLNKKVTRSTFKDDELASIGLKIVQKETFFIERLTESMTDEK